MSAKILIVDDDPSILRAYQRSLRKRYSLLTAEGGAQALELIEQRGPFAIVVADMRMPGMDGLQLLSRLKQAQPQTVRIMLTGNTDQSTAVEAVNQGEVFRFLTKPCGPAYLTAAIEAGLEHYRQDEANRLRLSRNRLELRELSEKLAHDSQHDMLTGLANRVAFQGSLKRLLASAQSGKRSHALCNIDLDNFHVINDTCGHFAGDECLKQVANLLSAHKRVDDGLFRLTANQFAVLLQDTPLDAAERLVRELHELMREFVFVWEDEVFDVSASLGLVPVCGSSNNVTDLLSAAETACHVAKDSGRNALHVGGINDARLTQRLNESQWINKIQDALRNDRFVLYHQPILPVQAGTATGEHYEILLRMRDKTGRLVSPGEFLHVAEAYSLATRIDLWVIHRVAEWFSAHPHRLERLATCSINLSGHSLGNRDVFAQICEAFAPHRLPPQKFCFEVTETAAIARLNQAVSFIRSLKAKGFRFSLDDFGSGFASFAYLKNLPVDYLKIDGQFIEHIHHSSIDQAIVQSIVEVAKVMEKSTIAEYVENEQVLLSLKRLGIDYAQGYHFSAPLPLDAAG